MSVFISVIPYIYIHVSNDIWYIIQMSVGNVLHNI